MNYYNYISSSYDRLHGEEQKAKMKIIEKMIFPQQKEVLLDVGCGSGLSTDWNCHAIGIDSSEKLIDLAKQKHPNVAFFVGKAEELPFHDHHFDYVICVTAIHNFSDIPKALDEIKRVGKRIFVISVIKKIDKFNKILNVIKKKFKIIQEKENPHDIIYLLSP